MGVNTEAARITAIILAGVTALVALTGIALSPEQIGAVEIFVGALVLIIAEFGLLEWLRGMVYSKKDRS